MAICKFFQQGNCRFGNSCRFEHPIAGNNRNQPQNRFGALASGAGSGPSGGLQDALAKYSITTETIEKDLTTEAPQWILSAYAPGRNAPEQLFGGFPREQSFEEMRMHYIGAKASGNEQQALNQAQELYQNAQQQMESAARNVQEAARFIVEAENKHPNRVDICREGTQGAPFGEFLAGRRPTSIAQPMQGNPFATGAGSTTSPFGSGTTHQSSSGFGQPTALGQRPNPFGTPAFGQPAQPSSGFGQQTQSSPFGQPSQTGGGSAFAQAAPTTSAFGQASTLGPKPSPFGTPASGQSSQLAAQGSAFGQTAQLGAKPNPFGSAGNVNGSPSPFATASNESNTATANPFASSNPHQNQSQNNTTPNPFGSNNTNQSITSGQSNPFGQNTQSPSPFGQAAKPNPFGSASTPENQQPNNPFAQNTQAQTNGAFGTTAPNSFGSASSQQRNPFGGNGSQPPQQAVPTGGVAAGSNPYAPGSSKQHPPIESYASKNMDGSLGAFKGQPIMYKDGKAGFRSFNGTWTRIWFPAGAPGYYKDTELPPESYDDKSKSQWANFTQAGSFADGIMPALPPPRECTQWDF